MANISRRWIAIERWVLKLPSESGRYSMINEQMED